MGIPDQRVSKTSAKSYGKRLVCSTSDYSCELLLSFAPGSGSVSRALMERASSTSDSCTLEIKINSMRVCVSENTSPNLLKMVLQVAADVK